MRFSILLNIEELFQYLPEYGHHDFDVTSHLAAMAGWSSALGVIVALLLLFLSLLMNKCGKRGRLNVSSKFLTSAFVLIWLAGFVIYDVGMYIGHNRLSLITNLPMAIVHAFEMFLLESDVCAIHEQFHDNWIFMGCFSIVHLLAAVITLIYVIKHFGYNIIAGFRMMFEAYFFKSKKETFVFWGMNEPSYLLARSIQEHYGENRDYRMIIVRTNHDGETTSVKNGMERLFNFLSLKNNDLERLMELDCLTTSTYTDLAHLSLQGTDSLSYPDILGNHLSLKQLARIIRHKTTGSVHLFFLTDDAAINIQAVGNLKRDSTINTIADDGKKALFYCQARYNSVHRVIEDEQLHDNITVKVVDTSHISVEILKQQPELHPVNFVNIEKDATVSSAFNALIVGFGEVGHDAMRFLYEFGAFVKKGSDSDNVVRSDFYCDVVDKNIKQKAGLLAVNAPEVSHKMSYDNHDDQAPIHLHEFDVLSVDFYNHVEKMIDDLNYVVVALDDDEENISLGVRIFRLAVRYRKDMNHFRILVRARNDNDRHLLRIAEHYNRLLAAELSVENGTRIHQKTIKKTDTPHAPITLFGSLASTYTYDFIVSDKLKSEAKRFKEMYDQSILTLNKKSGGGMKAPEDWEDEHRSLMQLTGDYKAFSPTLSGVMRLRRIQSQNMENCFHKFTKQKLAHVALGDEKFAMLTGDVLSRNENEITYMCQGQGPDAAVARVLEVLAQTEHLRWVASHEILGYKDDDDLNSRDEARLLHGCLKPWHDLSTLIKSYDYNVVDVSLGII